MSYIHLKFYCIISEEGKPCDTQCSHCAFIERETTVLEEDVIKPMIFPPDYLG